MDPTTDLLMNEDDIRYAQSIRLSRPSSLKDFSHNIYAPIGNGHGDTVSLVLGNYTDKNNPFYPPKPAYSNGASRTGSG